MAPENEDGCILTTARFFDSETREWGYEVICVTEDHEDRERCPGEREIFRKEPVSG